jgi:uncharacterized lipoprotein YmbA
MHSIKIIPIFFGLACLCVSGCINFSPTPDPSRFFTLTPLPRSEESRERDTNQTNSLFLGVGPIGFPAYLDREQIVTRISQNRLDISENDRWVEPLEENFSRVFSQNLALLLRGARVVRYPWQNSQRPAYQIQMEVLRFEPIGRQEVELLARWAVVDASNKKSLVVKESRMTRKTKTKSTEASVAALSEALDDLSREIADIIRASFGQKDHP